MIKSAIVLVGGQGTRLKSVVADRPKPLALVAGQPFLNYLLRFLKSHGIEQVVFSSGFRGEMLEEQYSSNFEGIAISYVKEETPMGTGGGIKLAMETLQDENILALNGDSIFDFDLSSMIAMHLESRSASSLAIREVANPDRYGTVKTEVDRITQFQEKQEGLESGLISAGIYCINRSVFMANTPAGRFSIERDFFEAKVSDLIIAGHLAEGYFIDIGIPEDYQKANEQFTTSEYR